ncbi:hypothetical protein EAI_08676 [Harpegnathos saltator]|uniref:Uncharacterized protein n=1 Tax=Harpegnathos saltator TaxID=610380 RepID=E2C4K9_HARSA|nr:hypothetical protein EAI_08676 [Harpegnathos saltator]
MKNKVLIRNQVLHYQISNSVEYSTEQKQNLQNVGDISEDNNDFRSRSPLHETSIIVPEVNWSKSNESKNISSGDSEIDSDSLSSFDSNEMIENCQHVPVNFSPPRLQIHSIDGDLLLDDGSDQFKVYDPDDGQTFEPDSIEVSFLQDRRLLDSPQNNLHIETVDNNMKKLDLQDDTRISNCSSPASELSTSYKQDNSEENDVTTAALTETGFSEWARDGEVLVSDDLCDVELNVDPNFITIRKNNLSSFLKLPSASIKITKEKDMKPNCSKINSKIDWEYPSNNTSKLLTNDENIDYMDTDNESLLDDSLQDASNVAMQRNRGYIEFVNIKTTNIPTLTNISSKQVNAPIAKLELENDLYDEREEGFKDANVIEIDPITMEDVMGKLNCLMKKSSPMQLEIQTETRREFKDMFHQDDLKQKQLVEAFNKKLLQSMEEDSLLLVELAEDTTTSEAVTVLASPINPEISIDSGEKIEKKEQLIKADCSNSDYMEYVKKLQSRIAEFSNAKDSIDIRKSKRKNSKNATQACITDMIVEEIKSQEITAENGNINSPTISRKLEEITRERSKQKNLIQDLLMDKLEAHKQKSAEKRARRAARTLSFTTIPSLIKSPSSHTFSTNKKFVPISITSSLCNPIDITFDESNKSLTSSISSRFCEQYDQVEAKEEILININQPNQSKTKDVIKSEIIGVDNMPQAPIVPVKLRTEQTKKFAEKCKHDAKGYARIKNGEDLKFKSEDKIREIKIKTIRRQVSVEDTRKHNISEIGKIRPYSFSMMDNSGLKLQISKSTDNMKYIAEQNSLERSPSVNAKSMDELLNITSSLTLDNNNVAKREKKKLKDPERRKSIIQAVSDFFFKKECNPLPNQKDKLSMFRLTPKAKGNVSTE